MENLKETINTWAHNDSVGRLLTILVASLVILLVLFYFKRAISHKIKDTDKKYRARKVINIFGYLLVLSVILFVYNDRLGNVGIALGLAGAGIAFALQEVVTSFAGWLNIMFTSQVKVGQRVKIGEITGDIIDIGVFSTTIMEVGGWIDGDLYNGRITTLSNSFVFKEPIQNYSGDYPFLWDEVTIPIRTESDFQLARKVLADVTSEVCGQYAAESKGTWIKMNDKFRIEDAKVEPMVSLKFDENWITFNIRYVVDYRQRRTTKDKLYSRLLEEIKKHGNDITIASSSMEIIDVVSAGRKN